MNPHCLSRSRRARPLFALLVPAIPYRTEAAVSTPTFAFALIVTIFVLGALVGILMIARRRGWSSLLLRRDVAAVPASGLQVEATRRLSMSSTAHVLSYEGMRFLVVECSRGATATTTPIASEEAPL